MTDLEPGQARLADWDESSYHADTDFVSRSILETLRVRGPAACYAKHIVRTMPNRETPALLFGRHSHLAVLEPDEWRRRLYPLEPMRPPGAYGRGKKDSPEKKAYTAWKADCKAWESDQRDDSIVLEVADRNRIEQVSAAVRRHEFARHLLADGAAEQTILWHHPDPKLHMRVRVDWLKKYDASTRVVVDLKTTSDPSPVAFGRSIAKFGYHRQGAIYTDAAQALYPDCEIHFILIAVRSEPPFEVGVYELEADELEKGRTQYKSTLADFVRRRSEKDWTADWQRGVSKIQMPKWAYHEE